jgi:hypothetical protein
MPLSVFPLSRMPPHRWFRPCWPAACTDENQTDIGESSGLADGRHRGALSLLEFLKMLNKISQRSRANHLAWLDHLRANRVAWHLPDFDRRPSDGRLSALHISRITPARIGHEDVRFSRWRLK